MKIYEPLKSVFFENLFDIKGRATRLEYWGLYLFNVLMFFILSIMPEFINAIYGLWLLIAFTTVSIRRMHDVGKSGWYYWWGILTGIGWLRVIYRLLQPSLKSSNKWGLPKI